MASILQLKQTPLANLSKEDLNTLNAAGELNDLKAIFATTPSGGGGGGGSATWGSITGTLSSQTDLQAELNSRALTSTTISAGTGLSGGGNLSSNRTLSIANTGVSPGTYNNTTVTVNAQGQITNISNGTAGSLFPSAVAVYAYTNAGQSIPQNTYTAINFNQEKYDTSSMHDNVINNSRITFPSSGYYMVIGHITANVSNVGNNSNVYLQKNGGAYYAVSITNQATTSGAHTYNLSALVDASGPTDYVELIMYNDFGGAINLTSGTAENFINVYRVF